MPGGAGTASEVFFALAAKRPVVLLGCDEACLISRAEAEKKKFKEIVLETRKKLADKSAVPYRNGLDLIKAATMSEADNVLEAVEAARGAGIAEHAGRDVGRLQFSDDAYRKIGAKVSDAVASLTK